MAQVPASQPRPEFPEVPLSEGYVTRRDQLSAKQEKKAKGKGKGKGRKAKSTEGDQDQDGPGLGAPKKTAAKSKCQKPQKPQTIAQEAEPKSKIRRLRKHIAADDVEGLEEQLDTPAPSPSTEGPTQAAEVEVQEHQDHQEGGDAKPDVSGKRKVKKDPKLKGKQPKAKGKAKVTAEAKGKAKVVSTKDVEVPKAKAKTSRRKARKDVGETGEEGEEDGPGAGAGTGRSARAPSTRAPSARSRGRHGGEAANAGNGGEDGGDGGNVFFRPGNPLHEALVQDILKCLQLCKQSGECGKKGKHTHEIPKLDMDGAHHFALSVYWSRNAVGVKARQNNVATGQVAYFAKQTPCCATNIRLATMWARSSTE